MTTSQLVVIIFTTVGITAILAILILIYNLTKRRKYDTENMKVQLERYRENSEKKIYDIMKLLYASESRWKDLNHLLITSQKIAGRDLEISEKINLTKFLEAAGIRKNDLETEEDLVFVLVPFHKEFNNIYHEIRNICLNSGFRCYRGDEEFIKQDVLHHIIKYIVKARVVIAVIDGRNPNVFYELGIVHALDKKTILISKNVENIPFDVKAKNVILYRNLLELEESLLKELSKLLIKQ